MKTEKAIKLKLTENNTIGFTVNVMLECLLINYIFTSSNK